jgi:S-adenosylmethionine decarboxylase
MSYHLKLEGCPVAKVDPHARNLFFCLTDELGLHGRSFAEHEFYPYGITIMMVLAESHISMHTWPEREEIQIDLFHCSEVAGDFGLKLAATVLYWFKPRLLSGIVVDRQTMEVNMMPPHVEV